MDQSFLKVMADRIETQSLSQYYDNANLGFIEDAMARTILASLLRSEDVLKLGPKWIAFVPSVLSESVWYMAFDPKRINLRDWEPEPFSPPFALVESIRQVDLSANPIRLNLSALSTEATTWDALDGVGQLYVFESGERKRLDDLSGQIVLAMQGSVFVGQAKVTRAVQTVIQQIRDRARLLSAAKPTTLRLLNQLDNRYQEKIVRAIEGRELNRLLQQPPGSKRARSKTETVRDMREVISFNPQQKQPSAAERFKASLSRYRGEFFRAASQRGVLKKDDQNFSSKKQLFPDFGEFHGGAIYKNGGRAFFAVVDRMDDFYELLVGFVMKDVYKSESVTLFILSDDLIGDEVILVSKPWKKLFESFGTSFDVEIVKE